MNAIDHGADQQEHDDEQRSTSAPVRPSFEQVRPSAIGKLATMPAKMISEMPLPTPRAVICSPSHIRNIVPPVSVMTTVDAEEQARVDHAPTAGSERMPSSPTAMP